MLTGTVIGVLVIPGLYYLFGRIADKRKLIRDEADEPLSEVFEHLAQEAHDGESTHDRDSNGLPLPSATAESLASLFPKPVFRRPFPLEIPESTEEKPTVEIPKSTEEKSTAEVPEKPEERSMIGSRNREIKRLARRYPRFGYRRAHAVLVRRGWSVNVKRVRRLWNSLGLRRPVRLRKPRKLGPKPGVSANSCVRATGAVQERHLDMRLRPRPNGRGSFSQVANPGGRIYSGVLGLACGRVAHGGRRSADHGPRDWTSRCADPHKER